MNKTVVTSAIIAFVLLIGGMAYVKYGNFNEIQPTIVEEEAFKLVGKEYKGKVTDEELTEMLDEVYMAINSHKLEGKLVICYDGNPDQDKSDVKVFAGVLAKGSQLEAEGFEVKELPAYKAVSVNVDVSSMFAPNPANINKKLKEFAEKQQISLKDIYLEKYISDKEIRNEIIVK
ncbi:GyrI-like domain-containing protein [Limibacter armeniacum]|uniref:GyrI-like domain-containing protein n=1 Tax=Limibacter armeniacum TaxID=466084 RepID=UPI002FE54398